MTITIHINDYTTREELKEQIMFYSKLAEDIKKVHPNVVMNIVVEKK
ncbi:hypothetical protein SDC9_80245 [bioreactor metagenome]|uniref:Uncharacterized protein n=1 Tax=bioreactor metagenome TaxID=1076179 RepID=A0A644Z047_9ZZZZ